MSTDHTRPLTEWVEFQDQRADKQGWSLQIDVSFLSSNWRCLFGEGLCPGNFHDSPADTGCCRIGAHFEDDGDVQNVKERFAELNEHNMTFYNEALNHGWLVGGKHPKTRVYKGACIFANRPGTKAGDEYPGCALHAAAIMAEEDPIDWKPEVCWQVPLAYQEDDEDETTVVSNWTAESWGEDQWNPLHWWCCDSTQAYTNDIPVYEYMDSELRRLIGDDNYAMVKAYLDMRRDRPQPVVFKGYFDRSDLGDGVQENGDHGLKETRETVQ